MALASTSITTSPTELVKILESTRPVTYSEIARGVAKKFRKLRDQTSSRNAMVTPCITRMKKSHKSTAPNNTGTKLNPADVTLFRYFVMNPHKTISMPTHA